MAFQNWQNLIPYFYAIGSNLAFGTAAIVFSKYAKSHSPAWMNRLKVMIGFAGFTISFLLLEKWAPVNIASTSYLVLSGFLGLCLGDLFLFRAFSELGPSRTLVLYSFQPLMVGVYGYLFLGQILTGPQYLAILCMIGCVFTFLLERNKTTGKWDFQHFLSAFIGIFFDAIGVMLTRTAYETTPELGSFQCNAIRAAGAIVGFIIISPRAYPKLILDLTKMHFKERNLLIGACLIGTFVSLSLYLHALKHAHVATLTSIAITGPLWVSLIEHIRDRELPNRYLVLAFSLFLTGFGLLSFY